ncbi:amidase, partial [Streptomyces sp. 8N706]
VAFTPFTGPWNIAGLPAVSVPPSWTGESLPIGTMLGAPHGAEGTLLALAAQLESASPWQDRRPQVW